LVARVYGTALKQMNPDAAFALFHNMRADTANYYFNERELNWLSYDFLRASLTGILKWRMKYSKTIGFYFLQV
jgi:hypothetical protein